jgi:hypothetical protein
MMRLRLLRRRLTVAAPRMAIRSALPWPFRWALVAVVLGFCGAIALWTFELGKGLAGLEAVSKEEIVRMRAEIVRLTEEREQAISQANGAQTLLVAEKAAQEKLAQTVKQVEAENRVLHEDLGFFEKLIPTNRTETIAIRGVQAERVSGTQLKWQVLLIQSVKNAPVFRGIMDIQLSGTLGGKAWNLVAPGYPQALELKQYRRVEGVVDVPEAVFVKNLSIKVTQGKSLNVTQTVKVLSVTKE